MKRNYPKLGVLVSRLGVFLLALLVIVGFWFGKLSMRELITYWPPWILMDDPVIIPLAIKLCAFLKIRLKVCWDIRMDLAASFWLKFW